MTWIDEKYINLISCRLKNFKRKKSGLYNCSCPLCGDSQKNKLKARGFFISKKGKWFYFCHNCGASKNFDAFLKDMDASLHKEYTVESWKEKNTNGKKVEPIIIPPKTVLPKRLDFQQSDPLKVSDLPDDHLAKIYVKSRKIPQDKWNELLYVEDFSNFACSMNSYYCGIFKSEKRLIIPFYDENSQIYAANCRAFDESTFRYINIDKWKSQIRHWYGLWRNLGDTVFVTEGPIDSLFLPSSVATCGMPTPTIPEKLKNKKLVFIFDNEPRNKSLVNMMKKVIDKNKNIVIFPDSVVEKDINEMILNGKSVEDIITLINNNTFCGMEAILRYNRWKKI